MKISKEIREAVARVFKEQPVTEKEYVGTITHHELREAAYLVGNIKLEISRRGKVQQTS